MHKSFQDLMYILNDKFIAYFPSFIAGIALILIGLISSWLVKRFLIQIAMVLRLERYFVSFRWGRDFVKADVRYGFYNLIGNVGFLVIFIMFIYRVTNFWNLPMLAKLLEQGIMFFPRLITALIVFALGWFVSSWASKSAQKALLHEDIPRATLISRFIKAVLLLFFSAVALTELDIAREIVIIGFATTFITLGILTIVFAGVGGKEFINYIIKSLEKEE